VVVAKSDGGLAKSGIGWGRLSKQSSKYGHAITESFSHLGKMSISIGFWSVVFLPLLQQTVH
jgi:hypothetical protein